MCNILNIYDPITGRHTPLNAENPIKESSEGRNANDLMNK
jgi:hypothetical protein